MSQQLALTWFDEAADRSVTHAPARDRIRARRLDPETSHAAAARSIEFSGKHAAAIFCWLKENPAGGTKDEISKGTGIDAVAIARRIPELRATAGVYDSGETRKTPTGRAATVWRVRT